MMSLHAHIGKSVLVMCWLPGPTPPPRMCNPGEPELCLTCLGKQEGTVVQIRGATAAEPLWAQSRPAAGSTAAVASAVGAGALLTCHGAPCCPAFATGSVTPQRPLHGACHNSVSALQRCWWCRGARGQAMLQPLDEGFDGRAVGLGRFTH